ncbi:MAG: 6-pyruvoyltetrahydropterin/6-carboxytetrahydropterin synthase [Bradymonadia bacterium]|jgi:6-pyruvoyltetrahydropterin/6-carboxytetrahydropterin synthase
MFRVGVRDSVMIAHTLPRPIFGPAQGMHGATFTVDVEFVSSTLTADGIVVDIAEAHRVLGDVLGVLNYQNLDEVEAFKGMVTTSEVLARWVHDEVRTAMSHVFSGSLKVTMHESHVAWASYETPDAA